MIDNPMIDDDYRGPLPTIDDVNRIADDIDNGVKWIRKHMTRVLMHRPVTKPREPIDDERSSGRGGNEPSRPTEGAALETADLHIKWAKDQRDLRYLLGLVHSNMGDLVQLVNAMDKQLAPAAKGKPGPSGPMCCEPACEDPSDNRQGRCNACYQWRWQWAKDRGLALSDAPPIPPDVIDQRRKLRENRKVHINGPFAEHDARS